MKNIIFYICTIFLWVLLSATAIFAQNSVAKSILVEKLSSLPKKQELESVYIQTSKGIYETEEDVWFKCYVLDSKTYGLSLRSNIMYIQLIDDNTNQTVWEERYEIENGFVDGHLYLADTLQKGTYTLAAYTSHSFLNNTIDFYAARKLKIVKSISEKKAITKVDKDSVLDFQLFPEGGNLVDGIQSTLAFKSVDGQGMPLAVSGILFENDKPLIEFSTVHDGMGRFNFKPDIKNSYYVEVFNAGLKRRFQIPPIQPKGIVMQFLGDYKNNLLFNISQSKDLKAGKVYFRLQVRGQVFSVAEAHLKDNTVRIKVPLKSVPQGIAEVTLFDKDFKPICERLVYINQDKKLYIKTTLDKSEYNTREKGVLNIKVTDENEQPIIAHLGVSIYDKIYQNPQDSKNILSHFYLTTQLKGKLHNPTYYFNSENKNRKEAMNLLLLTQGWRRYVWNEEYLKEKEQPKQLVFDMIKGSVIYPKKYQKKPLQGTLGLFAFSPENENYKEFIFVDSIRRFTVEPKHLKMGRRFFLKLLVPERPKYHFNIQDNAFKTINSSRKKLKIAYPFISNYLLQPVAIRPFNYSKETNVLEEVTVKAKRRKVRRDKYLGKLDSIVKLSMTSDYVCKENILNCPVHGEFDKGSKKPVEGGIYRLHWRTIYKKYEGSEPPISEFGDLPPYRYPVLTDEYLMSRFNLLRVDGFYEKKEFYVPNYAKNTEADMLLDYRNTLYWNPSIITDKNGEASIEFFCSDINTNFVGSIEGVGGNGLLGDDTFNFKVVKNND